MIILTTPRLVLRGLMLDDTDDLAAMYGDEETMRYMGPGGVRDRAAAARSVAWAQENYDTRGYGVWATQLLDGTFVGRCGLIDWEIEGTPELEIGYMIDRRYWGHGYATEAAQAIRDYAFATLRATRLISLIYPANTASIRVAEKNGMAFERLVKIPIKEINEVVGMWGLRVDQSTNA